MTHEKKDARCPTAGPGEVSGFWLDDAGISHGERPGELRGCTWQKRYQDEYHAMEEPVFTCEGCGRVVCYCGGHGCEIATSGPDAPDFCDECCPCAVAT